MKRFKMSNFIDILSKNYNYISRVVTKSQLNRL